MDLPVTPADFAAVPVPVQFTGACLGGDGRLLSSQPVGAEDRGGGAEDRDDGHGGVLVDVTFEFFTQRRVQGVGKAHLLPACECPCPRHVPAVVSFLNKQH